MSVANPSATAGRTVGAICKSPEGAGRQSIPKLDSRAVWWSAQELLQIRSIVTLLRLMDKMPAMLEAALSLAIQQSMETVQQHLHKEVHSREAAEMSLQQCDEKGMQTESASNVLLQDTAHATFNLRFVKMSKDCPASGWPKEKRISVAAGSTWERSPNKMELWRVWSHFVRTVLTLKREGRPGEGQESHRSTNNSTLEVSSALPRTIDYCESHLCSARDNVRTISG